MTIAFSKEDRELVSEKLNRTGLLISSNHIDDVLCGVEAAFNQQFDEEVEYMINDFLHCTTRSEDAMQEMTAIIARMITAAK